MDKISEMKFNIVRNVQQKTGDADGDVVVKLTKEDIKKGLGRQRLKQATLDKFKGSFEKSGLEVSECGSDICITIPAERLKSTVFTYQDLTS